MIHHSVLELAYDDERRARVVAESVGVEEGEIDDARSRAGVSRDGDTVVVRVDASDLVALRAGSNTWLRLADVAEAAVDAAQTRAETETDADGGTDGSR